MSQAVQAVTCHIRDGLTWVVRLPHLSSWDSYSIRSSMRQVMGDWPKPFAQREIRAQWQHLSVVAMRGSIPTARIQVFFGL